VLAGTAEAVPNEHGIDMSLRFPANGISAASLAFGVHCSVFKKRFPDGHTRAHCARMRRCRSDTHPVPDRERPCETKCWCQHGSAVPMLSLISRNATGVRGDWQDYRPLVSVSNSPLQPHGPQLRGLQDWRGTGDSTGPEGAMPYRASEFSN